MARGSISVFVPHQLAVEYEAAGWEYVGSDDGVSALYRWAGKGRPVFPEFTPAMGAHQLAEFDAVFGLDWKED